MVHHVGYNCKYYKIIEDGFEYDITEEEGGDRFWYLDGYPHRVSGPAVERVDGDFEWYCKGLRHRLDGPAVYAKRYGLDFYEWYREGNLHCETGPAIICSNGKLYWYLHDQPIDCETQEKFEQWLKLKAFW